MMDPTGDAEISLIGLAKHAAESLKQTRGLEIQADLESHFKQATTIQDALERTARYLNSLGRLEEAGAFDHVRSICDAPRTHGGLNLKESAQLNESDISSIEFLITAWLESLNSAERTNATRVPLSSKPAGRRSMTLTEKIFAMHDIEPSGSVKPGDTIRVSVDWIMASEASWSGMEQTYDQLGKPGIFRNDRFWLAGDHVVDPRVADHPTIKRLVNTSEKAKRVFKMTEYQGMNYTIMHTEFYRERAQPGMIVIGADSHTCSSGAVGCLAIGLGAADVTMGLVAGEIWFKVPECINIRLIGEPRPGIGGKDVILHILGELKRNTVAADRVVEYSGPGLAYLSPDARFAIANMTTEFGGITGVFVPDATTQSFINSRKLPRYKNNATYFQPDEGAQYAATYTIDLSKTESCVARYPNPDDVVPVSKMADTELDGCFIGACTTAEEDIILGALVLEQGLNSGMVPSAKGTRKVVPGSLPILSHLRDSGLADIYEQAGFEIGVPGCSYCVGMSADKAGEGEVWLSSQNRNFENRMGKGSIGNLASAATVAASSFGMKIADPQALVNKIDTRRWEQLQGRGSLRMTNGKPPRYVEPFGWEQETPSLQPLSNAAAVNSSDSRNQHTAQRESPSQDGKKVISGRVQRLGDFIDTDALAPAQYLVECRTNESIGAHCLEFTHPDFRSRVKEGCDIVVAGNAFGCGSSREQAVSALLGCGVKCVIAKSFAFIYSRNQPSLGLLGITIRDDEFYELAADGQKMDVDLRVNVVRIGGKEFPFELSRMEKELMDLGGITPAFLKFGKQLFNALCSNVGDLRTHRAGRIAGTGCEATLERGMQW